MNLDNYINLSLEQILNVEDETLKIEMLKLYRDCIKSNMTNRISRNVITKSILINNDNVLSVKAKQCVESLNALINNRTPRLIKYNNNSLLEMENKIQEEILIRTSTYLFPGDVVYFYPIVREYRAGEPIICNISGSIIQKGSYYTLYRPLIDNITTREHYILDKSLKIETAYRHALPKNICEFEEWARKLNESYSRPSEDDEINFYNFSRNSQNDLRLLKLRDKKRRLN